MESQRQEIESGATLNSMQQLKDCIIDCAKNIKSNDATFKISTLTTSGNKLMGLMDDFVDLVKSIDAHQKAFMKLCDKLEKEDEEEDEENADQEIVELETYTELFESIVEEEKSKFDLSQFDRAKAELEQIICPPPADEEIQVEAPVHQVPKDPITKRDIKVAVRSTACKHIFDKDSIEDYLKQKERSRSGVKCPQAGCTNRNMTKNELELDEETNRLIQSL